MRNKVINSICALAIGAVVLAPSLGRAQETSANPQAKLAGATKDIRLEAVNTRDQLKASVDALDALTKQKSGDLRPAYDTFVEEVKRTHDAAGQTAARAASMDSASKDYFGTWQTDVSGIAKESLRKNAQRRLDDVRKSYDKVIASLRQATVAFKPFLSDLDDVQKTLANDVTVGGVKAIRETASDAAKAQRKVLRNVNDAIDQLASMEKALSSQKSD
jgi:Mg2+ and Co2+ transporter CorA